MSFPNNHGLFCVVRCLLVVMALSIAGPAAAQSQSGATTNSAPVPAVLPPPAPADSAVASKRADPIPFACDTDIPSAIQGVASSIVVDLDPDTLWRPRGAEVRFTVGSNTANTTPKISRVLVCFRWSDGAANAPPGTDHRYMGSPLVRSIPNSAGLVEYGATVPELTPADQDIFSRFRASRGTSYTGVYTIPVTRMQVVLQMEDGDKRVVAVALPVGITFVPIALLSLLIAVICAAIVLARSTAVPRPAGQAPPSFRERLRHLPRTIVNKALVVISTHEGGASLSQFQIILWSLIVGGAAIYVMTLSGNLISVSDGTLVLLGIAGGTSILARVPVSGETKPPPGTYVAPAWRQMLTAGSSTDIDVTRVQMLIFTLVSAIFVAIKVAVTYSIPDIPPNFLLLMGISNGVYIAGKHV